MARWVYIGYAQPDQLIAQKLCDSLEASGQKCWIAPRDIAPGTVWQDAIDAAIKGSAAFVLLLSAHTSGARSLVRDVAKVAQGNLAIVVYQIEDTAPSRELAKALADAAWIKAEKDKLASLPRLKYFLKHGTTGTAPTVAAEASSPSRTVTGAEPSSASRPAAADPSPGSSRTVTGAEPSSSSRSDADKPALGASATVTPAEPAAPAPVRGAEPIAPPPAAAKGYVFLSYSSHDADFVERLRVVLQGKGYSFWDYRAGERDYGGALHHELEERIDNAAAFIAIVSDSWRESEWLASEYLYARDARKKIFVVQAKRLSKPVSLLLNQHTRIDMSDRFDDSAGVLQSELAKQGL
jgi:hypothetical protein